MSNFAKCLCILTMISCIDNTGINSDSSHIILHPEAESRIDKEVLDPSHFSIQDSILVVIEEDLENNKFKLFSINENHNLLTSFGNQGNGPNEFSGSITQPISDASNQSLTIFDWINKRLQLFELKKNKEIFIINKIEEYILPPSLLLAQKAGFINDSTVITVGGSSNGWVSFVNTKSDLINYFDYDKYEISKVDNPRKRSYFYDSNVSINSTKKLIAVAPRFVPELYIIDFEGNLLSENPLKLNFTLDTDADIEEVTSYFQGITSSEKYIFASYYGKSISEVDDIIENNQHQEIDITEIKVFDWNGDYIKTYRLVGGIYPQIAVDKLNTKLYSINPITSDTSGIVYFNLE